jgi:hypothetical protein
MNELILRWNMYHMLDSNFYLRYLNRYHHFNRYLDGTYVFWIRLLVVCLDSLRSSWVWGWRYHLPRLNLEDRKSQHPISECYHRWELLLFIKSFIYSCDWCLLPVDDESMLTLIKFIFLIYICIMLLNINNEKNNI